MLTEWAEQFTNSTYRFVVCSGGGPGIMEAANRGAHDAGGKTVGLNIGLPFEQFPNPYITPELSFEFHYFFMRKFWFAYLAKALVVFPGGFGTLDEMMEMLTLTQTQKLAKKMTIVLYGSKYWKEIINFDALVKYGMISPEDLSLFQFADDPATAFEMLKTGLADVRDAAGYAGSCRQSRNRATRRSRTERRARMFTRKVAPGIEIRLFEIARCRGGVRGGGAQSRLSARVAAVGGFDGVGGRFAAIHLEGAGAVRGGTRAPVRHLDRWRVRGSVGCHPIDWPNRNCSIGYWIDEQYQGKGIMTRCCESMLAYLFDELGLHRVMIQCGVGNTRSCAIPERLGSPARVCCVKAEWVNDHWLDLVTWGMLEQDWRALRARK